MMSLTAKAHHYKGLPHYSYFENYPQAPILEFIEETSNYEIYVTIYNFQGLNLEMVDAPDDVRFYIYIYDIENNTTYLGKADFEIYSHGEFVAKELGVSQFEESIYVLRKKIDQQDDLNLKVRVWSKEDIPFEISVPIQITETFLEKYGIYISVFLFFAAVITIKSFSKNKQVKKAKPNGKLKVEN